MASDLKTARDLVHRDASDDPVDTGVGNPLPVSQIDTTDAAGSPQDGSEVTVSTTSIQLAAANTDRLGLWLSTDGAGGIRVGPSGVTASTGYFEIDGSAKAVYLPVGIIGTGAVHGIRTGSSDVVVLVSEVQ